VVRFGHLSSISQRELPSVFSCAVLTFVFSNIIEQRYNLSELDASNQASYLLAGSIVLYPIVRRSLAYKIRNHTEPLQCGYVVDRLRGRPIILQLLTLSSCLTMTCYFWLSLPPRWTHTALPAVFTFGLGHGFATRKQSTSLIT
jgi:hypothetical protein